MLQFTDHIKTQRRVAGNNTTPLTSHESEAFTVAKAILHSHSLKDKIDEYDAALTLLSETVVDGVAYRMVTQRCSECGQITGKALAYETELWTCDYCEEV